MGDGEFSASLPSAGWPEAGGGVSWVNAAAHNRTSPGGVSPADPMLKDRIKNMALLTLLQTKRPAALSPSRPAHHPNLGLLSPYSPHRSESPPLHFSDSSSPPLSSPPLALANIDPSSLFYEPEGGGFEDPPTSAAHDDFLGHESLLSVLTHEHSDPLMSSTAAGESGAHGSAGLAGPPMAPEPPDVQALLAAQSPAPPSPMVPPKLDKLILFGCFRCNINCSPHESSIKQYVIHIFDQGCYFTPGPDPDHSLVISVQSSPVISCFYSKLDPNRAAHDQVTLVFQDRKVGAPKPGSASQAIQDVRLGNVFFTQVTALQRILLFFKRSFNLPWITNVVQLTETENPSVASHEDYQILQKLCQSSVAPTDAAVPVSSSSETLHFQSGTITLHASGDGDRLGPVVNALRARTPEAQAAGPKPQSTGILSQMLSNPPKVRPTTLAPKTPPSTPITPSSISALLSQAQPVPLDSLPPQAPAYQMQPIPTTNPPPYHSVVTTSTAQASPIMATTVTTNTLQATLRVAADFQNISRQYSSLTMDQSVLCISCQKCPLKFKYSIENLFHFILSNSCLQYVLGTRQDSKQPFYPAFFELMAKRCGIPADQPIQCDTCQTVVKGPMLYCIHRDQHRPAMGDLFPCQFCGFLFRAPHAFYRHECIRNLDPKSLLKRFAESQVQSSMSTGRIDTFRIYSLLTVEERTLLLKCPVCNKGFAYFSGLVVHIRSSSACLNGVYEQNRIQGGNNPNALLDLAPQLLTNHGLNPRPMECELCGTKLKNQIGYAIHRDHHALQEQGTLICKGCNQDFQSPCEFYRHNCQSQGPSLFWCPFCEISRHCDQLKKRPCPPTSAAAPVNLPIKRETPPRMPIVSVHSGSPLSQSHDGSSHFLPEKVLSPFRDPLEESLQRIHEGRLPTDELTPKKSPSTYTLDIKKELIKLEPTPPPPGPGVSHVFASKSNGDESKLGSILPGNFDLVYSPSRGIASGQGRPSKGTAKRGRPRFGPRSDRQTKFNGQSPPSGAPLVVARKSKPPPPSPPDDPLNTKLPQSNGALPSSLANGLDPKYDLKSAFLCLECDPPRILWDSKSRSEHEESSSKQQAHTNVRPLDQYDRLSIPVLDLKSMPQYAGLFRGVPRKRVLVSENQKSRIGPKCSKMGAQSDTSLQTTSNAQHKFR